MVQTGQPFCPLGYIFFLGGGFLFTSSLTSLTLLRKAGFFELEIGLIFLAVVLRSSKYSVRTVATVRAVWVKHWQQVAGTSYTAAAGRLLMPGFTNKVNLGLKY